MDPVIDRLLRYVRPETVWLLGEGSRVGHLENTRTFCLEADLCRCLEDIFFRSLSVSCRTILLRHPTGQKLGAITYPKNPNKVARFRQHSLPKFVKQMIDRIFDSDRDLAVWPLSFLETRPCRGEEDGCDVDDCDYENEIHHVYTILKVKIPAV